MAVAVHVHVTTSTFALAVGLIVLIFTILMIDQLSVDLHLALRLLEAEYWSVTLVVAVSTKNALIAVSLLFGYSQIGSVELKGKVKFNVILNHAGAFPHVDNTNHELALELDGLVIELTIGAVLVAVLITTHQLPDRSIEVDSEIAATTCIGKQLINHVTILLVVEVKPKSVPYSLSFQFQVSSNHSLRS